MGVAPFGSGMVKGTSRGARGDHGFFGIESNLRRFPGQCQLPGFGVLKKGPLPSHL
jgi:hypothetical protein